MQPKMYATPMMGTSFSQMLEMVPKPPMMISRALPHTIAATIQGSTPKFACATEVMALVCTADPTPKMVRHAMTANQMAMNFAHHGTVPSGRL